MEGPCFSVTINPRVMARYPFLHINQKSIQRYTYHSAESICILPQTDTPALGAMYSTLFVLVWFICNDRRRTRVGHCASGQDLSNKQY